MTSHSNRWIAEFRAGKRMLAIAVTTTLAGAALALSYQGTAGAVTAADSIRPIEVTSEPLSSHAAKPCKGKRCKKKGHRHCKCKRGPRGERGPQGERGPRGPQGPAGPGWWDDEHDHDKPKHDKPKHEWREPTWFEDRHDEWPRLNWDDPDGGQSEQAPVKRFEAEKAEENEAENTEAENTEAEENEAENTEAEENEAENTEAEKSEAEENEAEENEAEENEAEENEAENAKAEESDENRDNRAQEGRVKDELWPEVRENSWSKILWLLTYDRYIERGQYSWAVSNRDALAPELSTASNEQDEQQSAARTPTHEHGRPAYGAADRQDVTPCAVAAAARGMTAKTGYRCIAIR